MSGYTLGYLSTHTYVGDVEQNGMPWTARALGITSTSVKNADGRKWLWDGAIPLSRVRELLADFDVESYPLTFIRPTREGDAEAGLPTFLVGETLMTMVTDESRQVIADAKRDRVHFTPKSGYTIHPFGETLVDRVARIVDDSAGSLHVNSVGVLADGGEAWVSISTASLLSTPEGVDYYPHVLASSSHTGTLATSLQAVNTMTVCDNTRAMALGEGKSNGTVTKARHSKRSAARLADDESEARQTLGLIEQAAETFAASVKTLAETPITDADWGAFLDVLAPTHAPQGKPEMSKNAVTRAENFRDKVNTLYRSDARNIWQGTAFGALQAVNTYDLWERGAHAGTEVAHRNMRDVITGKVDERESERRAALDLVLSAK